MTIISFAAEEASLASPALTAFGPSYRAGAEKSGLAINKNRDKKAIEQSVFFIIFLSP
jgi:hypothetical protein